MTNSKFSQISLIDIYEDVNSSFPEKKSEPISLLEKHIDFLPLIPYGFHRSFYQGLGRKHKYHLESFIKALIIQKLFAFNNDSQLILILKCSDDICNFCGFDKFPDGSYFTRFKQKHCKYIIEIFDKLLISLNLSVVKLTARKLII
ncbi:MAG: transposase [Clostridia bacterium]|nr:transposase [Clostridia bacterium]